MVIFHSYLRLLEGMSFVPIRYIFDECVLAWASLSMHGEVEATSCLKQFAALTRNGSEQIHRKTMEKFHKVMVRA